MNSTMRFAKKLELSFILLDLSIFPGISLLAFCFLSLFVFKNNVLKSFEYLVDLIAVHFPEITNECQRIDKCHPGTK